MNLDPLEARACLTPAVPALATSSSRASATKTAAMCFVFASTSWRARAWPVRSCSPGPDPVAPGAKPIAASRVGSFAAHNANQPPREIPPTTTRPYPFRRTRSIWLDMNWRRAGSFASMSTIDRLLILRHIPFCDLSHLSKDQRNRLVFKALCMKIEQERHAPLPAREFREEKLPRQPKHPVNPVRGTHRQPTACRAGKALSSW